GKITAGDRAGDYDVTVSGTSVSVVDVEARDDVTLSATGSAGTLAFGFLTAPDALTLSTASTLNFDPSVLGQSSPKALSFISTSGAICLGTVNNNSCTPGAFNRSGTSLTLSALQDIRIGDVTADAVKLDSSSGAITVGNVSSAQYVVARAEVGSITLGTVGAGSATYQVFNGAAPASELACNMKVICIISGFTSGTVGAGSRRVTVGNITASNDVEISGRDGVQMAALSTIARIRISALEGAVAATGNILASGPTALHDIRIRGNAISLQDVTSTNQSIAIHHTQGGTGNITVGNLSAGQNVQIITPSGSVTTGNISARSDSWSADADALFGSTAANSPCGAYAVCIYAGGVSGGVFSYSAASSGTQSISTGTITTTNRPSNVTNGGGVLLNGRTGVTTNGTVDAKGSVRLNAINGRISTSAGSVTAGDGVDIQAGVKTSAINGEDPYVADSGTFDINVGNVTANNGSVLINAREGVSASTVTQQRSSATVPTVPEIDIQSRNGSVQATV
ncbi:MAG: hypothetical protein EBZ91_13850, partial [Gammaproteobacteria bacterium]|nr:hypothetical protein [Gammaproteobacteria bacterium]